MTYGAYGGDVYTNQPQSGQAVIVQPTMISMGEDSVQMTCPACRSVIRTAVRSESGPGAYIGALVIAMFG
jgi:hypothetical protein